MSLCERERERADECLTERGWVRVSERMMVGMGRWSQSKYGR